ncbi:hypothetical protein JW905_17700, partial [bacterium]|nr:hypothetical protein [candidate division CSSED10-310 bacterium]
MISTNGRGILSLALFFLIVFLIATGAESVEERHLGPPGGNISAVCHLGYGALVAGTIDGRLFYSADRAGVWVDVTPHCIHPDSRIEQIQLHAPTGDLYIAARNMKHGFVIRAVRHPAGTALFKWQTMLVGLPVRSVAVSDTIPPRLYVGTDDRLFYSVDGGEHWDITTFDFPDPQIESVLIDPDDPQVVYAGTWQRAFKSCDGGRKWRPVHTGMASDSDVFSLLFDHDHRLFAGTCGWAYMSLDSGASWRRIKSGLGGKRIHVLRLDAEGRVLAGTDNGLFRFQHEREQWTELIPGLVIYDIAVDDEGSAFCATDGSGVVRLTGDGAWSTANAGLVATSVLSVRHQGDAILAGLAGQGAGGGLWRLEHTWCQVPLPTTGVDVT